MYGAFNFRNKVFQTMSFLPPTLYCFYHVPSQPIAELFPAHLPPFPWRPGRSRSCFPNVLWEESKDGSGSVGSLAEGLLQALLAAEESEGRSM